MSKYIENDGSLASHYWRREFQTWRGDDQMWPLVLDWNWGCQSYWEVVK